MAQLILSHRLHLLVRDHPAVQLILLHPLHLLVPVFRHLIPMVLSHLLRPVVLLHLRVRKVPLDQMVLLHLSLPADLQDQLLQKLSMRLLRSFHLHHSFHHFHLHQLHQSDLASFAVPATFHLPLVQIAEDCEYLYRSHR
jgi:hypothetical protein